MCNVGARTACGVLSVLAVRLRLPGGTGGGALGVCMSRCMYSCCSTTAKAESKEM